MLWIVILLKDKIRKRHLHKRRWQKRSKNSKKKMSIHSFIYKYQFFDTSKQAHTITEPPPNLTVGLICRLKTSEVQVRHTHTLPSRNLKLNFISLLKTIIFSSLSVRASHRGDISHLNLMCLGARRVCLVKECACTLFHCKIL